MNDTLVFFNTANNVCKRKTFFILTINVHSNERIVVSNEKFDFKVMVCNLNLFKIIYVYRLKF